MSFVELNRTFKPFTAADESDVPATWFAFRREGLRWPDLLSKYRVVVIAEANSGKSEEFQARKRQLASEGKPAFFVPLESLCTNKLEKILEPDERDSLETWKAGTDDAYFFLDSVDEATTLGKHFKDALRNIYESLENHLGRARIFVSSRPKDWQAMRDDNDVKKWLSPADTKPLCPASPEKSPEELMLDAVITHDDPESRENSEEDDEPSDDKFATIQVVLKSLDFDQRRELFQAKTQSPPEQFEYRLGLHGLIQFATSPGDLLKLINYWTTNGRLGSRREMCRSLIEQKLKEIKNSDDALGDNKAMQGAKRVAAAMTLCRTFSISTAGENPDGQDGGMLGLKDILTDWSNNEREALLGREVFAPHAFGKVKFYHREAQEYLCAQWFVDLIENHCPPTAISDLLFPVVEDFEVVSPTLKPVAAWLALSKDEILDEVIKRDPSILIQKGDPGTLAPSVKAKLLRGFASQMDKGDVAIQPSFLSGHTSWLFADPRLSIEIREVWKTTENHSLRLDLLQMIEDGVIKQCSDLAEFVALDETETAGIRSVALNALNACNAARQLRNVATNLVTRRKTVRADHASEFASRLYPDHLSADELFLLVESCPKPPSNVSDGFGVHLPDLWADCPQDERLKFARRIALLLLKPPFHNDYQHISENYRFLAKRLPSVANELFKVIDVNFVQDEAIDILLPIGRARRFDSSDDDLAELRAMLNSMSELKRKLLWRDVDFERSNREAPRPNKIWQVPTNSVLWEINESDVVWLKEDLGSKATVEDRQVALSALAQHFVRTGQIDEKANVLESLIGDDLKLQEDLRSYTEPPPASDEAENRLKKREEKLNLEREKQLRKIKDDWIKFRNEVVEKPEKLLDPETQYDGIESLISWLQNKTGEMRHSAAQQWESLRAAFSEEVANNFQAALKATWRKTDVARPERKGNLSSRLVSVSHAYAGVTVESEGNSNWTESLSDDEVTRAARIACESEIDYPDWLNQLIEAKPKLSAPVFLNALKVEFESSDIAPFHLTYRLKDKRLAIPSELMGGIIETICTSEFVSTRRLEDAIRIILRLNLTSANGRKIATTFKSRFQKTNATDKKMKVRYLALWMTAAPVPAINALKKWLSSADNVENTKLAIEFIGSGFGHHGYGYLVDFLSEAGVSEIEQLALIANCHIRTKDDPFREGHWTPNQRDAAQQGRNRLISELSLPATIEGLHAISRLMKSKEMKRDRYWLGRQARTAAELIGDFTTFTIEEFTNLQEQHFHTISNANDLFRVVNNVLAAIKQQLGNSDSSTKLLLESLGKIYAVKKFVRKKYPKALPDVRSSDEEAVQNWLAEQLRLRSNGRYHVQREPRVAKKKMPDIIVSDSESRFEVAIEIKQADSWSPNQLIEALDVQLAETYLKPEYRRHGVLFMTDSGRRAWWTHPDTRKRLRFDELTQFLSDRAGMKVSNEMGTISTSVVGVDIVGDHASLFGTP